MLGAVDWAIVGAYFVFLIFLGFYFGKGQRSGEDYFLASKSAPSWAVAFSIMATQCGVISLIGAPAFVALASDGGAKWLQYEFAVPLAMVLIMIFLVPVFFRSKITTAYEYLEKRFDSKSRALLSFMFLLSRGLATGVTVYAAAIVLSVSLGINLYLTILLIGVISVVYTWVGGMKAVIYSDVIQLIILWGSVFVGIFIVLQFIGFEGVMIPAERAAGIDFTHTGFDGATYAFWPMVIGGIFHYFSYYGCDQSQTQRFLSTSSPKEARRSLFMNGFLRFPLVLSYILFGLFLIGFIAKEPSLIEKVNATGDINTLVPIFVVDYFPTGLAGIMIAGMFAAAMSSIDSALNSLAATTMNDFYKRYANPEVKEERYVSLSKLCTLVWGIFCVVFAFFVGNIAETVIEGINMIGSAFYGPILGAFILGIINKRSNSKGVIVGVIAGILFNLLLAIFAPQVSWMWWNAIGFAVTFGVGYGISLLTEKPVAIEDYVYRKEGWSTSYTLLILYFFAMIVISYSLKFFGG